MCVLHKLDLPQLNNRYFILSGPGTRKLLSSPEVVGFSCYSALLDETVAALRYLRLPACLPIGIS